MIVASRSKGGEHDHVREREEEEQGRAMLAMLCYGREGDTISLDTIRLLKITISGVHVHAFIAASGHRQGEVPCQLRI